MVTPKDTNDHFSAKKKKEKKKKKKIKNTKFSRRDFIHPNSRVTHGSDQF